MGVPAWRWRRCLQRGGASLLRMTSPSAFFCFCATVCFSLPAAPKMMKVAVFYGNWCFKFFFSAGMKAMAGPILVSVFFFFCFVFLSFFPLFSLSLPLFCSPFYRDWAACPKTNPAGLLFNPRTRSWARDVVHDWIGFAADFQLPCWIGMKKTSTTVPPNNGAVSAEMDIFILTPDLWKFKNWILSN